MDSLALAILFSLAAIGSIISFMMIPDAARIFSYSFDADLDREIRQYSGSFAARNVLPGIAIVCVATIGGLTILRVNGIIEQPVASVITFLSILAVAMMCAERVLTFLMLMTIRYGGRGEHRTSEIRFVDSEERQSARSEEDR